MNTKSSPVSNSYWQLVLSAIPVGVMVVDQSLIIQAINPAAEQITGIGADEAIGQPYDEVMQTYEREIADPLKEALETGQTFVNQRFYLRLNEQPDKVMPIRHSATVLTDEAGEVIGGVTIFADISRQVTLERQLEDHRRYLRNVLRSMPDGVAIADESLKVRTWNEAATKITGRPAAKAIGEDSAGVLGPSVASILSGILEADADILNREARIPTIDGELVPINFSASRVSTGRDGEINKVVVFRDISERLEQEAELRKQRHYLSQIFEVAPEGIFTVDAELRIQTFNQAAEALTGYAASFAIDQPYQNIVKIDPESGTDPLPLLVAAGGPNTNTRLQLVDANGKKTPIRYSAAALGEPGQPSLGGIVVFQDVSDIVAAERTKNEFISMVSHELRTPLTSIKGFITALLDGRAGEITEQQKRFLSICREQSNLLLSLINDLLDLSRMESGKLELSKSRFSVASLAERVLKSFVPIAQRKQITIEQHIMSDLPLLWADEDKIFQVLQNLLSNAVKFTPPNKTVSLNVEMADQNTMALSVTDEGIGIAPEDQEQIFDPFYQVENIQTRQVGGTGLGLPIVRRIIEMHDGYIELESEEGAGSTFRVFLPLASTTARTQIYPRTKKQEEAATASKAKQPDGGTQRLNPLVLVVDDDVSINTLVQFTLESEGYDVISATGGREALQLAAEEQPDLITLDLLMPEIDGYRVLDLLKQNPETADIPVCIVSIVEDKVKGYKLGAIDYITKPFEREQLLGAIGGVLSPRSSGDEVQVLVVEDDLAVMELVEVALADTDYEILMAHDGIAALEQMRRHLPDLILLDIMIPKIDGYQVIRQAKSDPRTAHIPIIVLSVRALEEDISRALRLGAEKYLTKISSTENQLSEVIQNVVKETLENVESDK